MYGIFAFVHEIVCLCMNMAFDNSNTCIGYILPFYSYMYNVDNYRTICFSINQLTI